MSAAQTVSAKVRKFPCANCGADVRWDPGASALKCPYCGTERKIAAPAGEITEKSVDAALRTPRDLGWGAERKVMACKRCGAHTTLEPHVSASSCPFCGTSAIVESPPNPNVVRPEGLLPFKVPRETAVQQFQRWLKSLWLRPNDLTAASHLTDMRGVYIPFWTFDAATHSYWTAMAGYYYYVTVRDSQGRSRQERRIRWEPASGQLELFFDDVPIPASRGIDAGLARGIEPYPTDQLTPYEPSYLSGFLAEENAIDLPEALEAAKERMRGDIYNACAREVPGDTHQNLQVRTRFSGLAYKNALLPIWIAAYNYHNKPYRYIVNGVTGKAHGTAPWSIVKIMLLIIAAIFVLMLFGLFKESASRSSVDDDSPPIVENLPSKLIPRENRRDGIALISLSRPGAIDAARAALQHSNRNRVRGVGSAIHCLSREASSVNHGDGGGQRIPYPSRGRWKGERGDAESGVGGAPLSL